jgi:iron(III) transport system substrate-binding protein
MTNIKQILAASISTLVISTNFTPALAGDTVNIYSYRQPELIAPLLEAFTNETGIKVEALYLGKGVMERLKAEGVNSPADVILTVDISRLVGMKNGGVTQSITRDKITANIPPQYRDSEGHWFGLTTRARVVFASRERVEQNTITYEELAQPKWKGRICSRSGQNAYNIALIASIIANKGEATAKTWLTGVKNNLARSPAGNDRAQVKAVYSGECDIAIGNTYYAGLMRTNEENPEQKEWEASVKILFPNSEDRGTHVNLSGMAMAKNAPNRNNAITLMEFLSSAKAQEIYAEQVFEYPIKEGTKTSQIVTSFGELKADNLALEIIAKNATSASRMVDIVGFDN